MKILTKAMLQSKLRVVDREAEAPKNRARRAETKLADAEEQYQSTIDDLTTEVQEGKDAVVRKAKEAKSYQAQYSAVVRELREAGVKLVCSNEQQNDLRAKLGTVKRDLAISEAKHYAVSAVLDQMITKLIKKETL